MPTEQPTLGTTSHGDPARTPPAGADPYPARPPGAPDDISDVTAGVPTLRARRWRTLAAVGIVGMVIVGSLFLSDHAWPFAPFRMFAHANKLDGLVYAVGFRAETADGDEIRLDGLDFGLRRAEVEGNLPDMLDDPAMLAVLAETYNERHPNDPIVRLEMIHHGRVIEGGYPTESYKKTLQVWEAP